MIDVKDIRKHFKIYDRYPDLCYLDSAASALKLEEVTKALTDYMDYNGTNVHRGVYKLSYEATNAYEETREVVAKFIGAKPDEIVFTRGTSDGLNMLAQSYGLNFLKPGDEIISSELEHHSSQMPWLNVSQKTGATIKYVKLDQESRITIEEFKKVLTKNTKVVALTHVSNVMGYVTPIKEIIKLAHEVGALVIVDGAQSVPHMQINVKDLDCDFLAFSGHKLMGPNGVGVLYGKKKLLDMLPPVDFGGDMAEDVYTDHMSYKDAPYKFETGTPMVAEVIALKEAIKFIEKVGIENIYQHEKYLHNLALAGLAKIKNVEIYNPTSETGIISFNIKGTHPHDAASVYDKNEVCLRAGHHCAELIMHHLQVVGTLRASFYLYNDEKDVERFLAATKEASDFFAMFMEE